MGIYFKYTFQAKYDILSPLLIFRVSDEIDEKCQMMWFVYPLCSWWWRSTHCWEWKPEWTRHEPDPVGQKTAWWNSSRDYLDLNLSFLTTVVQESFVRCRKRMQLQEETDMNLVKWFTYAYVTQAHREKLVLTCHRTWRRALCWRVSYQACGLVRLLARE